MSVIHTYRHREATEFSCPDGITSIFMRQPLIVVVSQIVPKHSKLKSSTSSIMCRYGGLSPLHDIEENKRARTGGNLGKPSLMLLSARKAAATAITLPSRL